MKAIICERYGPPESLVLKDIEKPAPAANEILVRTRATTVTTGDWRVRSLDLPRGFKLIGPLILGFGGPRTPILGCELSGIVEAVGAGVTRFAPGDAVIASSGTKLGCHVELKCFPEDGPVAKKPENLSFIEAAGLCFGGLTALHFLRTLGKVKAGEAVLVNGASGGVGSAAVQIARHLGATVTGVASAANLDLVRDLGAERVIDYRTVDFADEGERYDVIIDPAGTVTFDRARRALKEGGRLLMVLSDLPAMLFAPLASKRGSRKFIAGVATDNPADVQLMADLAGSGAFRPVVDRVFPFEDFVAAHAYVEAGGKRGNVVLDLGGA